MSSTAARPASSRSVSESPARLRDYAGAVAGPLFLVVWLLQGLTREGYDFSKHVMSLLALGSLGWIQIANFVVVELAMIACASSLRSSLTTGTGSSWVPRLVWVFGVGLVLSGVFTTDPGAGFPEGAPAGAPDYTLHGILHEVSHGVLVVAWIAACLVLRRRFKQQGDTTWARLSLAVVLASIVLVAIPHWDSFPVRMVLAGVLQLAYLGAVALHVRR